MREKRAHFVKPDLSHDSRGDRKKGRMKNNGIKLVKTKKDQTELDRSVLKRIDAQTMISVQSWARRYSRGGTLLLGNTRYVFLGGFQVWCLELNSIFILYNSVLSQYVNRAVCLKSSR